MQCRHRLCSRPARDILEGRFPGISNILTELFPKDKKNNLIFAGHEQGSGADELEVLHVDDEFGPVHVE